MHIVMSPLCTQARKRLQHWELTHTTTLAAQVGNPVHRRAIVAFIGFCIYSLGNGLLILALGRYENDHPTVQTRAPPLSTASYCPALWTKMINRMLS